jgi:hypothetical protein
MTNKREPAITLDIGSNSDGPAVLLKLRADLIHLDESGTPAPGVAMSASECRALARLLLERAAQL